MEHVRFGDLVPGAFIVSRWRINYVILAVADDSYTYMCLYNGNPTLSPGVIRAVRGLDRSSSTIIFHDVEMIVPT